MPVTTRQRARIEDMLYRAMCIVRLVRDLRCVSIEQLKEFKICKVSLMKFSHFPNVEKRFHRHHVINKRLLKLMDEMSLIAR